jgi:hypothetical protein
LPHQSSGRKTTDLSSPWEIKNEIAGFFGLWEKSLRSQQAEQPATNQPVVRQPTYFIAEGPEDHIDYKKPVV